jgi:hypothetical protein
MLNRMKHALCNENGGPTVDNIVGISVALLFVIALGGLAAAIFHWVAGATGAVESLHEK